MVEYNELNRYAVKKNRIMLLLLNFTLICTLIKLVERIYYSGLIMFLLYNVFWNSLKMFIKQIEDYNIQDNPINYMN